MTSKVFEDPLDSEEFDCVQYINNTFPTEGSLDTLDTFIVSIGAQISTLDEEISKAVQTQSVIGKEASKDIVETQQSIEDLFTKINDIKLKASQSEKMVQEICADIKKLDYAKNHLQTSITSLNRLQMLINAVGQLEILAHEQAYRDAANLLDAVKQFMTHFDQYQHISVIQDIVRRVEDIFRQLARAVDSVADAELVLDLPGGAGVGAGGGMKILGDSCLCVDALGPAARKELLEEFVQLQLVPYDALFSFGKQHCQLDQVDRRWSWFKRLLKHIDVKYSIFPTHWRLPLRLCMDFTERTKVHLVALLTEMESTDSTDVHILLKALQSTLRFEQEMTDRFNLLQELSKESEEVRADEQLKRDDKLMYIPTDHTAANKEDETGSGFIALAHSTISGVSGVFDKFLGSYVLLERQNLEDMLHRLSMEEDTTAEGAGLAGTSSNGNVYGSSTSMFVFIK
ncbi:Vps53-like protein, partial [Ochromonadaceae sp. CCMP2298]